MTVYWMAWGFVASGLAHLVIAFLLAYLAFRRIIRWGLSWVRVIALLLSVIYVLLALLSFTMAQNLFTVAVILP